MSFIPATGAVAKVAIEYTYHGDVVVNTLWFERTDEAVWDTGTLDSLCQAVEEWLTDDLMPILSDDLVVDRIYASRQDSATSLFFERFPTALIGGELGVGEPANVAVSVKFASSNMGRSYRGRNFVGGLPPSAVDGSIVDTTFVSDLIAAYGLLPTTIASYTDAQHVICSHFANGAPRETAVTVPVQAYAVRKAKVNTMKSRVK